MTGAAKMKTTFEEKKFTLHNPEMYNAQCNDLDGAEPDVYQTLSRSYVTHYTKT